METAQRAQQRAQLLAAFDPRAAAAVAPGRRPPPQAPGFFGLAARPSATSIASTARRRGAPSRLSRGLRAPAPRLRRFHRAALRPQRSASAGRGNRHSGDPRGSAPPRRRRRPSAQCRPPRRLRAPLRRRLFPHDLLAPARHESQSGGDVPDAVPWGGDGALPDARRPDRERRLGGGRALHRAAERAEVPPALRRRLHLPAARNGSWAEAFTNRADPTLRSGDQVISAEQARILSMPAEQRSAAREEAAASERARRETERQARTDRGRGRDGAPRPTIGLDGTIRQPVDIDPPAIRGTTAPAALTPPCPFPPPRRRRWHLLPRQRSAGRFASSARPMRRAPTPPPPRAAAETEPHGHCPSRPRLARSRPVLRLGPVLLATLGRRRSRHAAAPVLTQPWRPGLAPYLARWPFISLAFYVHLWRRGVSSNAPSPSSCWSRPFAPRAPSSRPPALSSAPPPDGGVDGPHRLRHTFRQKVANVTIGR